MDQGFRRGFTPAEKAELWGRWQRGESLKAIGGAFGKPSSSIYFQVAPPGVSVLRRGAARDWH
jgi:IS30 family transposase